MTKKLEIATNVSILIVAILASAVLIKNYLLPQPQPDQPPQVAAGDKLSIEGIDWQANGNTLLVALSPGCDSCSESAPFYRRLATELPSLHMTALLTQSVEEGRQYLRSLDVNISDVRQGSFRQLKIRGTPTLILVDQQGLVRNVWLGRPYAEKEQEVIETIRAAVN